MPSPLKRLLFIALISALLLPAGVCLVWAATDQANAWTDLLEEKKLELALLNKNIQGTQGRLEAKRGPIRDQLLGFERRYFGLLFVLRTTLDRPYEASLILRDLAGLSSEIDAALTPFRHLETNISLLRDNLFASRSELELFEGKASDPGLLAQLGVLEKLLDQSEKGLLKLQDDANQVSDPLRKLRTRVELKFHQLNALTYNLWEGIFLNTTTSVIYSGNWVLLPLVTADWWRDLSKTLKAKTPHSQKAFSELAWVLLLVWTPLFLACRWLFRKKLAGLAEQNPVATRSLRRFLLLAPLAIAMLILSYWSHYPDNWLWDILAMIFTLWSLLLLGSGLRNLQMDRRDRPVMTPLVWLYVLCAAFYFFDTPYFLDCLLWSLAMVWLVFVTSRRLKTDMPTLERGLVLTTLPLAFIMLALSVSGMGLFSIYILKGWLIAGLGIPMVWAASSFLKQTLAKNPTGSAAFWTALAAGFGSPVLWLSLIALEIIWLAHHLGGIALLREALDLRLKWGGLDLSFSSLSLGVSLFFIFRFLAYLSQNLLARLGELTQMRSSVIPSLQTIASYTLWAVFIYIFLKLLGLDLTSLLVVAGGMSVGIGFGLQNIVNNFVSGLILLLGRSVHQGDIIEVNNRLGRVVKIHMRTTVVKTRENTFVMVPNSDLISKELTNWTRNDRKLRREIKVGVAYGSDPEKVKELLLDVAGQHHHVLSSPRPRVLFWEFGDNALTFNLRVWVDTFGHRREAESDLRTAIYRVFNEHGIEIAFPQLDVHLKDLPGDALGLKGSPAKNTP